MTKIVCESLNEFYGSKPKPLIRLNPSPAQKAKSSIFGTKNYAILANEMNIPFKGGKIDIPALHKQLQRKGYSKSENELRNTLIEVAPILGGLLPYIPGLSKRERSDIKFMEKGHQHDIEDYMETEISPEEATEEDYVIRSMEGGTTPGYYRFGKPGTPTPEHDRNMLRAAYAHKHAHEMPETSIWGVYLGTVPARVGHVLSKGKSFERTRPEGYQGKEYKPEPGYASVE